MTTTISLRPAPVSSRQFMWKGSHGVAEASELNGFGRVWSDSCDEGLTVVSARTGDIRVFVVDHVEYDPEGDTRWWDLKSLDERLTLTVFND